MTIDPGKSGTGYAVWNANKFERRHLNYPIEHGSIHNVNVDKQYRMFKQILIKYFPVKAYIEDAAFMYSNAKTQAAANTGSLVVLAEYIGSLLAICKDMGTPPELISVAQWKGTLSKEITSHRVMRKLPRINAKSHAMDAIALGMYLQGQINQTKGARK